MIGIKLEGRLGNQLFQYAFIYATAKKFKTSFYIDKSISPFLLRKYFQIDENILSRIESKIYAIKGYKNIFSYHLPKLFYPKLQEMYNLEELGFDNNTFPNDVLVHLKNKSLYKGFFQSEFFFYEYADDIKKKFIIKHRFKRQFDGLFQTLPQDKDIVVVHIRQGDYVSHGFNLPLSYYHNAINLIYTVSQFYIFVSDNPEIVATEFDYIKSKYISTESEIIDFQFIMNANYCILSNSSFSWWAAYLNIKAEKIIVPKYWLGKNEEYPKAIILKKWVKI